jgi:hypothetical protein
MTYTEFADLHASGITAMRTYFDQAEKTTTLLGKCTAEPLPFSERLIIASQEIAENSAHADYLTIKRRLHDAARLGYQGKC